MIIPNFKEAVVINSFFFCARIFENPLQNQQKIGII